jgi:hypothetical protein
MSSSGPPFRFESRRHPDDLVIAGGVDYCGGQVGLALGAEGLRSSAVSRL